MAASVVFGSRTRARPGLPRTRGLRGRDRDGRRPGCVDDVAGGQDVKLTVFSDVHDSMRIARVKAFGHVVVVIPYDDVGDFLRIANDSPYGLGGSVWTKERQAGLTIGRWIRTGTVGITSFAPEVGVPFGGFKSSGIGSQYGPEAFDEYQIESDYGVPA
jgi:aldehyde dehydrogenase (NAD+)